MPDAGDISRCSQATEAQLIDREFLPLDIGLGCGKCQQRRRKTAGHAGTSPPDGRPYQGSRVAGQPRKVVAREWQSQTIAHVLFLSLRLRRHPGLGAGAAAHALIMGFWLFSARREMPVRGILATVRLD